MKPVAKADKAGVTAAGDQRVPHDVHEHDDPRADEALLQILALGQQDIDASRIKPVAEAVARLRGKQAGFQRPRSSGADAGR